MVPEEEVVESVMVVAVLAAASCWTIRSQRAWFDVRLFSMAEESEEHRKRCHSSNKGAAIMR